MRPPNTWFLSKYCAVVLMSACCGVAFGADKNATTTLQNARALETSGRFTDAAMAYSEIAINGPATLRRDAISGLVRVIRQEEQVAANQALLKADALAQVGELTEAIKLYDSVAATGPALLATSARLRSAQATQTLNQDRHGQQAGARLLEAHEKYDEARAIYAELQKHGVKVDPDALRRLLDKEENKEFWEKYFWESYRVAEKAVVLVGFAFGLSGVLWILERLLLRRIGSWRGRRCLSVEPFITSTPPLTPAFDLRPTIIAVHETMVLAYSSRKRVVASEGNKLPVFLSTPSSELIDVLASTSDQAAAIMKWALSRAMRPAFRIGGSTMFIMSEIRVRAWVEKEGRKVREWHEIISLSDWLQKEEQLAYDMLMTVKRLAQ